MENKPYMKIKCQLSLFSKMHLAVAGLMCAGFSQQEAQHAVYSIANPTVPDSDADLLKGEMDEVVKILDVQQDEILITGEPLCR
jgi:uncharacterized protein YgfB (UPF0149 family)